MMRKVGGPGAPERFVPGHHRPARYKHLSCQKAAVREVFPPRPRSPCREQTARCDMRHSRAPWRVAAAQKPRGNRPILKQTTPDSKLPMKGASTSSNFRKDDRPCPATFAMAQALVTNSVPQGMQTSACPQIRRQLISFSALSNSGCAADMENPVTTIERVGRTMEAKALRPRSNRNDE